MKIGQIDVLFAVTRKKKKRWVIQKDSFKWYNVIHMYYIISFNPFPHNDTFWHPWETSLLKTL